MQMTTAQNLRISQLSLKTVLNFITRQVIWKKIQISVWHPDGEVGLQTFSLRFLAHEKTGLILKKSFGLLVL